MKNKSKSTDGDVLLWKKSVILAEQIYLETTLSKNVILTAVPEHAKPI